MAQVEQSLGGNAYIVSFADDVSLVDDATQVLDIIGYNAGTIHVKYITAALAVYTGVYDFYRTADTATILIQSNSTDFDDADTDTKFDLYVAAGIVYLKNRTAATVTCNVMGLLSK